MRLWFSRLAFITLVVLLVLPIASATAAPRAYTEGIEVHAEEIRGDGPGYTILDLRATKLVDGRYRQTVIEIEMDTQRWYIERQTLVLLSDPDNLEVSRDLGWGGLEATDSVDDTQLYVWLTFKDTGVRELHPIWISLTLLADEPRSHYESDGYFYRSAAVDGTVNVHYYVVNLFDGWPWTTQREGRNFTDQWPGR